ncbi:MAG: N-acetylmuramoyl-L-alanine amidase [Patescibacteria group bacterium]|mgnify:CR=1 FL=1
MKKLTAYLGLILFFTLLCGGIVFADNKKLKIISRQEWGANEDYTFSKDLIQEGEKEQQAAENERSEILAQDPEIDHFETYDRNSNKYVWPLQYAKSMKFIVIHHTAVMNNLDNPIQDIRNIYHSHAVEKGWGDIGYHFLIDRKGNIYEGRKGGTYMIGGHALPVNKVSIGISLMGNYNENELPAPMLEAVTKLIDEQSKFYGIDPLGKTEYNGKTYWNVHGHSDNTPKSDPGFFFDRSFGAIRQLVADEQKKETKSNPEKYDFSPMNKDEIISMPPDQGKAIQIKIKNTGAITWNKDTFIENLTDNGAPKLFAKLENEKVEIGNIGTFKAKLPASLISGLRLLKLKPVVNGDLRTDKTFLLPVFVEELKLSYDIIGRNDLPGTLKQGKTYTAWIMRKNTGNFTWRKTGKNQVNLGTSHPKDRTSSLFGGQTRIGKLIEKEVKPGETGKFTFTAKAKKKSGTFQEFFQPIIESVTWMPDKGMHFTVKVEGKEKTIRVLLSFFKKKSAQIKSESGMKLFAGNVFIHKFEKNELVTVKLLRVGGYSVKFGKTKLTLNEPLRFKPNNNGIVQLANYKNSPAWNASLNDNVYQGVLEVQKVDDKLAVINELQVEDYLRGLAESSNSESIEKIKTIIILARSYAEFYRDIARKFPGKPYDLDDDPDHTQKYLGYGVALRATNIVKAVNETAGRIVTYNGVQVVTPYFTQSDGRTLNAEEAWGRKDLPYLQSVPDKFCGSTKRLGHGVGVSGCGAAELAKQGKTAEEIIKYYYKGVEITD